MIEMTTLAAALYRRYETTLPPGHEDTTPGITARFEVFQDDTFPKMEVSAGSFDNKLPTWRD